MTAGLTVDEFLARQAHEGTAEAYRVRLRRCGALLGKPPLRASPRDLATLKARLRELRSGPGYAATLGTYYRAAGRTDLAALSRMKQRLKVLRPEEILTPDEVRLMIENSTHQRNRALIGVLWDTGGRITESLASNLGQVRRAEPEGKRPLEFELLFTETKSGEPRPAWVLDTAPVLDSWLKAHPFRDDPEAPLFPNADRSRLSRKRAWAIVAATGKRAKLGKPVWPHLFRHSRTTALRRMGVSEDFVKQLMGWSPRSTQLSRYSHLVSGDAHRALLRARGFEAPAPETYQRVLIEEDRMVPVVPLIPSGARKPPVLSSEVAAALEDPRVRTFILALSAMRKATHSK